MYIVLASCANVDFLGEGSVLDHAEEADEFAGFQGRGG
jgi:hypothetical protein